MFDFKQMNESLKGYCTCESIFDYYRLVDPKTHEVFKYDNNSNLEIQKDCCFNFWGKNSSCPNCIVKQSYIKQRQYVKLEFIYGKVMFIVSKPIKIEDKIYILELIKDITSSMIGLNYYRAENQKVEEIISQFNELAVRDILTGLYNIDYILNYLDDFLEKEIPFNTLVAVAIDIDNYTELNALYGYSVGNEILQYISGVLEKTAISYDAIVGRLGADELGIFFINKTTEEVEKISKIIYEKIKNEPLDVQGKRINISFTYAVTEMNRDDDSEDFIGRLLFNLRAAQVK